MKKLISAIILTLALLAIASFPQPTSAVMEPDYCPDARSACEASASIARLACYYAEGLGTTVCEARYNSAYISCMINSWPKCQISAPVSGPDN